MKALLASLDPRMELAKFLSETTARLVLAAVLGGMIGLERELNHKPAGLRTNMFICFGAAMYTVLSFRFSPEGTDHTRIAAQIITGIGFIGAGSILHSRGSVTGLTTAATMFVVASIGMAAGGGEYLPAIFATILILVALNVLGRVERRFSFKSAEMGYAITGKDPEKMLADINRVLGEHELSMKTVHMSQSNGVHRIHFTVDARHKEHEILTGQLKSSANLERVELLHSADTE